METTAKNSLESLKPHPKSNPILGMPINLLYLQDGNNLAAVVIREDSNGNLLTLSAESDLINEANAIRIDNLKDFQFRLQDIFNHNSSLSIYHEDHRIDSLVIIKPNKGGIDTVGRRPGCNLPPRRC